MPPRAAGGAPMTQDDINQLILQLAQSSQQLNVAVASLTSSQSSFMRSAADADANIGLSKAHSLLPVEIVDARTIDNTVNDDHRSGLPAALRDLRPSKPADLPRTLVALIRRYRPSSCYHIWRRSRRRHY